MRYRSCTLHAPKFRDNARKSYFVKRVNIQSLFISAMPTTYATLPTTSAATPSSSLRTSIFIVTPVFALNAMRTIAATLPPVIVLPYSLSVCVVAESATSVPSRG
jgi:hypothetical protein